MLYFSYSKGREKPKMTTFNLIIIIMFVFCLVGQFAAAIEKGCNWLSAMFAFEIIAFAYLAKVLM